MQTRDVYDYIVIGGGSSGCIVAARLAEERAGTVLLLEAGNAADENPETMSAHGFMQSFANDRVMWDRLSVPQPDCDGRRFYVGAGTGMGGSGAVNGMVYTRGDKLDFAQWPTGWQWSQLVPAFEALEKRLRIKTRPPTPFLDTCADAAVQAGFVRKDELNDGELCGFMGYQMMNYDGDRRRSSYMAFVRGLKDDNLIVQTDALAHRIVFDDDKRAVAVEYEQHGNKRIAAVRKEVVLCAGACETPKLLMLSGIGESRHLRQFGIREVLDAPAIGKNLQDHLSLPVFYRGNYVPDSFYPQLYGFDRVNDQSSLTRGQADTCYIFFTNPTTFGLSTKRMLPAFVLPPSLFNNRFVRRCLSALVGATFAAPPMRSFVSKVFGIVVILGKPQSRGEVRLGSNDPRQPARIDPRYLSNPQDLETLVDGVLRAQQIATQPRFDKWGNKPLSAIASTRDREAIRKGVRSGIVTTFHYAGTCKMGEGDDAPVDLQLRVKGIANVRVADASVIPEVPVSAINAPSMLIGYRAADFILSEVKPELANTQATSAL